MSSAPEHRRITLASGIDADILVKGGGEPLVFLHPAMGRTWCAFLDGLAERFTVYAPMTPYADEPERLIDFDGFGGLALYYDDLFRALGIERAVLIGHSFGGMAAAEFAARYPDRVSKLVLIDALGLWSDETPVADIHSTHPTKIAALLFADPDSEAARAVLSKPTPQDRLDYQLVLGAAAHFTWPIPERDLKSRLYRITAPTLLLWGSEDQLVPPSYADAFAAGIADTKSVIVEGAGHFPYLEKTGETLAAVDGFLDARVLETAS